MVSRLFLAALAAAAVGAVFPHVATAHRDGSWMLSTAVQRQVESRGDGLATCRGRGPLRLPVPIADPRWAYYRHCECFADVRGGRVLCVHVRSGNRLVLVPPPKQQRRCRF